MQFQFVPVEEFYFALTLCVKTLEEIPDPTLLAQVKTTLAQTFGQSSTVAAAQQNTFNYVFRVTDPGIGGYGLDENGPLIVSVADWQDKLRLGSDFGWVLDSDRKPVRTDQFAQRAAFTQALKDALNHTFHLQIP